mmetsp:Transcript_40273/g.130333  ORF Transcript_40273/g.130333 Transcript_40273/m.130333 type:complete len:227 (+) Transcript_40273:291-971(+)
MHISTRKCGPRAVPRSTRVRVCVCVCVGGCVRERVRECLVMGVLSRRIGRPRRLGGPRLAVAVAGPRRALVHHAAVLLEVRLDVCLGEAVDVHQLEDGLWLGVVEAELVARRLELRVQRWGPNEAWPGLLVQLGNRRRRRERWRKGGRLDRNVAVGGEPPWHDVLCAEQAVPAVRLPKHCVHRHRLPERGGAARENGLDDGRNRRRAPLRGRVDGGSHGVEDVAGH